MSLFSTIASSANRVIREILEMIIVFVYLTIIPVIFVIAVTYRIATNTICIYDIIWIAIAVVLFGIQIDLFMQFEEWLGKKLGRE